MGAPLVPAPVLGMIANSGEPILFAEAPGINGFAAEHAKAGETIGVWTNLAITSDERLFHQITESLASFINQMAQQNGRAVSLDRYSAVLLVPKSDNTAQLWLDTAAIAIRCVIKQAVQIGTAIFDRDIADVIAMTFPRVNFEGPDRVVCLFRQDWRFGLVFDFNPDGNLDVERFFASLGTAYRELCYRHVYDTTENQTLIDRVTASGWFPFVEIVASDFKLVMQHSETGADMAEIDALMVARFDQQRIEHMLSRWLKKTHFFAREQVLRSAMDAFIRGDPGGGHQNAPDRDRRNLK